MAVSRHSIRTVAERRKMRMGVMATLYVLVAVAFAVKQGVDTFGVKGIFNLLIYENLPSGREKWYDFPTKQRSKLNRFLLLTVR